MTRRRAPIAVYLRPAEIEALVEAATSALEAFPSSPERFDALGDARRALERARERADKRAEARPMDPRGGPVPSRPGERG